MPKVRPETGALCSSLSTSSPSTHPLLRRPPPIASGGAHLARSTWGQVRRVISATLAARSRPTRPECQVNEAASQFRCALHAVNTRRPHHSPQASLARAHTHSSSPQFLFRAQYSVSYYLWFPFLLLLASNVNGVFWCLLVKTFTGKFVVNID
jgi:hypothetical protein